MTLGMFPSRGTRSYHGRSSGTSSIDVYTGSGVYRESGRTVTTCIPSKIGPKDVFLLSDWYGRPSPA